MKSKTETIVRLCDWAGIESPREWDRKNYKEIAIMLFMDDRKLLIPVDILKEMSSLKIFEIFHFFKKERDYNIFMADLIESMYPNNKQPTNSSHLRLIQHKEERSRESYIKLYRMVENAIDSQICEVDLND